MSAIAANLMQVTWTAIGDGILTKDVPGWCEYTGQRESAVQEWGWLNALHPEDREQIQLLWQHAIATRHLFEAHPRIFTRDNIYRTIRAKFVPLFHSDGSISEWVSWLMEGTTEPTTHDLEHTQNISLEHLIFEQAPSAMVCLSLDGHFIRINEQFCAILGFSREELLKMRIFDLYPPDDLPAKFATFRKGLLSQKQYRTFEEQHIHKNGSKLWVRVTTSLLRLPSGEPLYFLTVVEDITRRKHEEEERQRVQEHEQVARAAEQRAQQEVIELGNLLNVVFDSIADAIIIYSLEGKVLKINTAAMKLLELPPGGPNLSLTYYQHVERYEILDEQHRPIPMEQQPVGRILYGNTSTHTQERDIIIRMPSGNETQVNIIAAPFHDQQGNLAGSVCIFRDVTERRKKERRVLQALSALLMIVEALVQVSEHLSVPLNEEMLVASAIGTIGEHLTNVISQVLDCRYALLATLDPTTDHLQIVSENGLTSKEMTLIRENVNVTTFSDYLEDDVIASLCANQVIVRDLEHQPFNRHPGFGIAPQLLIAPLLLDKKLLGIFVIGRSDTATHYTQEEMALVRALAKLVALVLERMRLLEEWAETHAKELSLEETNRHFDAFLSIASHELRTPLTTIKGNIQLALRRLGALKRLETASEQSSQSFPWYRIQQPLDSAIQRADVQDRMISELLDASRIRANKLEYIMHPQNLVNVVRDAVEDIQQTMSDRIFMLHLPDREAVPILADADRIGQVIHNYLSNAIKYSPDEQPIEVRLQVEDTNALISVRDWGQGLPPEDQLHVWERFYRASSVNTKYGSGAGLGLGLYICRTIIEQHQGQVGLQSAQGEGSLFWFTLPLLGTDEAKLPL